MLLKATAVRCELNKACVTLLMAQLPEKTVFLEKTTLKETRDEGPEYSVLILTKNEADNLKSLLPQVQRVLTGLNVRFEIVVIDAHSKDGTYQLAKDLGALACFQEGKGYGAAFREGVSKCSGKWILALDADHSHPPAFLRSMVNNHGDADLLIASRYVPGGDANMESYRNICSRILSFLFGHFLAVPVKDVSSGFRVYRREAISKINLVARDFDVLIEIMIKMISKGYKVKEIPFLYEPRVFGMSNARLFKFAISYLRTLKRMWNLRNSGDSADYEERAYRSYIPLQAFWQRKRLANIKDLIDRDCLTLDIGSGSSRSARCLPNVIAVDINQAPLRFLKNNGVLVTQASLFKLPFADNSVPQIILNNVIQHIPREEFRLDEISRVLTKGGRLVIGTADFANNLWQVLDKIHAIILPRAPGSLIKSKYCKEDLKRMLLDSGFVLEKENSILEAEITLAARLS